MTPELQQRIDELTAAIQKEAGVNALQAQVYLAEALDINRDDLITDAAEEDRG